MSGESSPPSVLPAPRVASGAHGPQKLGACVCLILLLGALPAEHGLFALALLPVLFVLARRARVELRASLRRAALAAPFLLSVASLSLFRWHGALPFVGLLAKCSVSVLTLQLLASTTPISELLRALRGLHVPEVFCTTVGLLHRYSFLLAEESKRMRRARSGRTLDGSRWALWRGLGSSLGLLFVRTVFRAERIQIAMRSRGGG